MILPLLFRESSLTLRILNKTRRKTSSKEKKCPERGMCSVTEKKKPIRDWHLTMLVASCGYSGFENKGKLEEDSFVEEGLCSLDAFTVQSA
jgi:hypothetical protein